VLARGERASTELVRQIRRIRVGMDADAAKVETVRPCPVLLRSVLERVIHWEHARALRGSAMSPRREHVSLEKHRLLHYVAQVAPS